MKLKGKQKSHMISPYFYLGLHFLYPLTPEFELIFSSGFKTSYIKVETESYFRTPPFLKLGISYAI